MNPLVLTGGKRFVCKRFVFESRCARSCVRGLTVVRLGRCQPATRLAVDPPGHTFQVEYQCHGLHRLFACVFASRPEFPSPVRDVSSEASSAPADNPQHRVTRPQDTPRTTAVFVVCCAYLSSQRGQGKEGVGSAHAVSRDRAARICTHARACTETATQGCHWALQTRHMLGSP